MFRSNDFFVPTTAHMQGRFSPFERHEPEPFAKFPPMHNDLYGDTDSEGTPSNDFCFSDHRMKNFRDTFSGHDSLRAPSDDSFDHMDAHRRISHHAQQQFKCRQLPCRTFVSTGSCPYGDRCVFLHDASIVAKPVYIKTKRKSKDDSSTDAFFWPTMSLDSVMGKVDNKNMPHIAQPYIVPAPCSYYQMNSNNDNAVFSMWEHFLDFCKADALSIVTAPRKVPALNSYNLTNPYTGKRRLAVFARLSQSKPAF